MLARDETRVRGAYSRRESPEDAANQSFSFCRRKSSVSSMTRPLSLLTRMKPPSVMPGTSCTVAARPAAAISFSAGVVSARYA